MKKLTNYLRGSIRVEAAGAFPERFVNLCAQRGLAFWGVEWEGDRAVRLRVPMLTRRTLDELADRSGCTLRELDRSGLPVFLSRFRGRHALWAGLACALLAVFIMSKFVLVLDVQGNERVSEERIRTALWHLGVRPGVYGPSLDFVDIEARALLELRDLSWLAVNRRGTRAEILVRERVKAPDLVDEEEHGDLVARIPGLVLKTEILAGESDLQEGTPVAAGDLLITGHVLLERPLWGDHDLGWQEVRAKGHIFARTWHTLRAVIPLEAQVKTYTGEEKQRWYAEWLGQRINFYGKSGISFPRCDKIKKVWKLTPSLTIGRETQRAYTLAPAPVDPAAAERLLQERLTAILKARLERGSITGIETDAQTGEGYLALTLKAECVEEIGRFVPFTGAAAETK